MMMSPKEVLFVADYLHSNVANFQHSVRVLCGYGSEVFLLFTWESPIIELFTSFGVYSTENLRPRYLLVVWLDY